MQTWDQIKVVSYCNDVVQMWSASQASLPDILRLREVNISLVTIDPEGCLKP